MDMTLKLEGLDYAARCMCSVPQSQEWMHCGMSFLQMQRMRRLGKLLARRSEEERLETVCGLFNTYEAEIRGYFQEKLTDFGITVSRVYVAKNYDICIEVEKIDFLKLAERLMPYLEQDDYWICTGKQTVDGLYEVPWQNRPAEVMLLKPEEVLQAEAYLLNSGADSYMVISMTRWLNEMGLPGVYGAAGKELFRVTERRA